MENYTYLHYLISNLHINDRPKDKKTWWYLAFALHNVEMELTRRDHLLYDICFSQYKYYQIISSFTWYKNRMKDADKNLLDLVNKTECSTDLVTNVFNVINDTRYRYIPTALEIVYVLVSLMSEIKKPASCFPVGDEEFIFEELMYNVGLDDYDDTVFDGLGILSFATIESKVLETMQRVLGRKYDEFGSGGFFPLSYKNKPDQREVPLIHQMLYYLNEK